MPTLTDSQCNSEDVSTAGKTTLKLFELSKNCNKYQRVRDICQKLNLKQGVHSSSAMQAAGFQYTNIGDTARCDSCGLEVSDWTTAMVPFTIHKQRNPTCAFVCSIQSSIKIVPTHMSTAPQLASATVDEERPYKRQKTEITKTLVQSNELVEVESLKEIRKRTFSHWPQHASSSSTQMIDAGFFNCNVGDRVICIYCNLICQQWIPYTDDPCEVHKTLSPKCPYVTTVLIRPSVSMVPIINENVDGNTTVPVDYITQFDQIVSLSVCHASYKELPKRYASFSTWPNEQLPNVDDLVNAGFFYTGIKTVVTCFYCNGSLQNWGANDNPMIEHARWFPNCAYAKQLCGANLYKKIRATQQRFKESNKSSNQNENSTDNLCGQKSKSIDDRSFARLVAARLDLQSSQNMLNQNFSLAVVKRCWEDQLRLKHDDFISDTDLFVACNILQKQIQYIDGKKKNIIIPSVALRNFFEGKQTESLEHEQTSSKSKMEVTSTMHNDAMSESSESNTSETNSENVENSTNRKEDIKSDDIRKKLTDQKFDSCVLCLTEEKCLAFIPCGHVATCVPCGHSLKSCPICRTTTKAFVRVYL